jgi:hypothetical protein
VRTFVLKPEHITLLRQVNIGWDDTEFGAPQIDPKRPYGNSDVLRDIASILGLPGRDQDSYQFPPGQEAVMAKLHSETQTALAIVLQTGSFEPGTFNQLGYRNWERA